MNLPWSTNESAGTKRWPSYKTTLACGHSILTGVNVFRRPPRNQCWCVTCDALAEVLSSEFFEWKIERD
jgi:hypothetical protein